VVSVLTEARHFKGSLEDLLQARKAVQDTPNRPALLRKDFVVHPYQVAEARAFGADTVLLIVAVLNEQELVTLVEECRAWGMEPLVEVANEAEMRRALHVGAKVIGINNRDLHTFHMDLTTTPRLTKMVKDAGKLSSGEVIVAALSGITSREEVQAFETEGVKTILVGEALMRAQNPAASIAVLLGRQAAAAPTSTASTLVKVCGVTQVEDAMVACRAGASFIGVIFAKSKRTVTPEQADAVVSAVWAFGEREAVPWDAESIAAATAGAGWMETGGTPAQWFTAYASVIEAATRRGPLVVGVFKDQSVDEVVYAASRHQLDLVQLHGDENVEEYAAALEIPCIKVIHVPADDASAAAVEACLQPLVGHAAAVLLDTEVMGLRGGTGVAFDWSIAASLRASGVPCFVGGGLSDTNVKQAVQEMSAWCVDASSKLEGDTPGRKDHAVVDRFVRSARGD